MSYSDDLDWLARNVHEWKDGKIECIPMQPYKVCNIVWSSSNPCDGWITKDQWITRRAELQNKPSWAASPTWAEWLVQDEDGVWYWHGKQPKPKGETVNGEKYWVSHGESMPDGCGELLSDWRSTLERRPGMRKTTEEIDTPAECAREAEKSMSEDIEDVLELAFWEFDAARSKSGEERICFKNKARWLLANYGARGEPEHNDDWHERGELPPVGVVCEATTEGCKYEKCEILAFHKGQVALRWFEFNGGCLDVLELDSWTFRPIKNERDELIDVIVSQGFLSRTGNVSGEIADAILAAGFTKGSTV